VKVLVTGAGGQVGRELARHRWPGTVEVVAADRRALDVTDPDAVRLAMDSERPDVVVNAAAYTAVDRAEAEPEAARAVNALAVAHLADLADRHGARLVHLSTDYVFDGTKDGWYVEADPPHPLGVYGATKLAGERAALASPRAVVLRTAWVYSASGSNFVTTMLRLAGERPVIGVVDDQRGCPTAAGDLAAAVAAVVTGHPDLAGLWHLASPAEASWHQVAVRALAPAIEAGTVEVRAITTAEYPTAARRPANSRLDSSALERATGIRLPDWRPSLDAVLATLSPARPGTTPR
jgi:dTDP-4-dehydrorhamnose reductase